MRDLLESGAITSRQVIALTAIRTCYSAAKPSEIVASEWGKYFTQDATDGGEGKESDRLFRHIVNSGHTSTLESISYTFAIEGISRACLAQLTRHRVGFSFSVQSQRYVRFGSGDKTSGFDYVVPDTVKTSRFTRERYESAMQTLQETYDMLREFGVPAEDARMVLPNAAATNLTMTANLRALLDFYGKRRKGRGAQWEIAELAERLREEVTRVDPWTAPYFDAV
ncbi:FAD-dependent thymidylate synthase [Brevibacillus sp. NL20B1]|uniref:FAD-dependent thymidylate synthase n=1 Tax=Brevibacillus sp. NL20B1 TaxID=2829799 RepID=UPI002011D67B|nr:FAD-dependent thymidylate synthase [Brevibacillus sp. NL20B1]